MNPGAHLSHPRAGRPEAAFTMIEIAISLGVIAFALIAIIGILPTGLQTGRDNREETLVNQDARLLIEAIKTGGRDLTSDIGSYVVSTDGVPVLGIATTNLIQLLSDAVVTNTGHRIVLSSISGAIANRGSDLGFHYEVLSTVTTNYFEFYDSVLAEQFYEVRLRFAWPMRPGPGNTYILAAEPNRYVVRALITGVRTNNYFFAQHYYQPLPLIPTNSVP